MGRAFKSFTVLLIILMAISGCASDADKKKAHFEKGNGYFEKGEYKSAVIEYKNAVQLDPKYLAAYIKLGETYLKLANAQEAFRTYARIEKLDPDNLDATAKMATFYLLAKKTDEAKKRVDKILAKTPDHVEALNLKAGIQIREKDLSGAVVTFKHIIAVAPEKTRPYLGLARVLTSLGQRDDARAALEKAIAIDTSAIAPHMALVRFYIAGKKFESAESELRRTIALHPENSDLSVILGNFYVRTQKPAAAEKAYRAAITKDAAAIKPYLVLAGFLDATGRGDDALKMYQKARELKPDDIRIQDTVARYYFKHRDFDHADKIIAAILDKRPRFFPSRLLKSEINVARRQYPEAIALLDQLVKEDPRSSQAFFLKGLSHIRQGDRQVGKKALDRAVELNPGHVKARLALADLALSERDFDTARRESQAILDLDPHNIRALETAGNADMLSGNLTQAENAFSAIIKVAPDKPIGYYRMGLLARQRKANGQALTYFNKALALNPKLVDVFTQVVLVHLADKKSGEALSACNAQLEKVKDTPALVAAVQYLKGNVWMTQKKIKNAEAAYQAALTANPDFLRPYYALARIYMMNSQQDKAISQYQAALAKNPNQAQPHMMLGTIYDMQKRPDLSEKEYRQALKINPDFVPAANNLAYQLAEKNKDLDQALSLARKVKEKYPNDPRVMDTLGWILYKKGIYASAIAELKDSLTKMPKNPAINYHLGMAYHGKGDTDQATKYLKKALSLNNQFDGADQAKEILSQ